MTSFKPFSLEMKDKWEMQSSMWEHSFMEACIASAKTKPRWIQCQVECCPKTQQPHWQLRCYFENPVEWGSVQALTRDETGHCEMARSTSSSYEIKEETRWPGTTPYVYGDPPKQSGKRTDCEEIMDMIKEGKTGADIINIKPNALRMRKAIKEEIFARIPRRDGQTECLIIWGPTSVGKSWWVEKTYPDYIPIELTKDYQWWDGYEGQDTVLIDEFDSREMKEPMWLSLFNYTKKKVPVKGAMVEFRAKRVILTSNINPAEWFRGKWTPAMKRRVTGIWEKLSREEESPNFLLPPWLAQGSEEEGGNTRAPLLGDLGGLRPPWVGPIPGTF